MKMTQRLRIPAPGREAYTTPNGWAKRPWTLQGVQDVLDYGGWFEKNADDHLHSRYSFADRAAMKLAGGSFVASEEIEVDSE